MIIITIIMMVVYKIIIMIITKVMLIEEFPYLKAKLEHGLV